MTNEGRPARPVLVYGATGHTGRAVVGALVERGHAPVLAARDPEAVAALAQTLGLESRGFAAGSPDLAGVGMVLNCAGPFADTALPLARAAVAVGAHYLDIAAEQPSTLAVLHSLATPAQDACVVVMPGVGFYGGLGDLLTTATIGPLDGESWDHVGLEVDLSAWHPSDGTLRTGERNPGARLRLADGMLVTPDLDDPLPPGRVELRLSEPILMSRHLPVRSLLTTVNASATDDLEAARDLTPEQRAAEREAQADAFRLRVEARRGDESRTASVSGDDFYAVTGPLAAELALAVLAGGVAPGGRAPGELSDPGGLLRRAGVPIS